MKKTFGGTCFCTKVNNIRFTYLNVREVITIIGNKHCIWGVHLNIKNNMRTLYGVLKYSVSTS